jgi:hypothetical protein
VVFGNVSHIVVSDNIVSCPNCGGAAKGIEGYFTLQNDSFAPIAASEPNLEILRRLYTKAKEAGDSADDREALIREVEAVSPALASALAPYARKAPITLVFLVLMIVLIKCNFNVNVEFDVNEAIKQATHQVEQGDKKNLESEVTKAVEEKLKGPQETERPTKRQLRRQRGQTKMKQGKP